MEESKFIKTVEDFRDAVSTGFSEDDIAKEERLLILVATDSSTNKRLVSIQGSGYEIIQGLASLFEDHSIRELAAMAIAASKLEELSGSN